jgi:hypothetical protein
MRRGSRPVRWAVREGILAVVLVVLVGSDMLMLVIEREIDIEKNTCPMLGAAMRWCFLAIVTGWRGVGWYRMAASPRGAGK